MTGIYRTTIKNGQISYRASITHKGKHISLGSYTNEHMASRAYQTALLLLKSEEGRHLTISDYTLCGRPLPYEKWVILMNLRDNGIYIKTPIYLHRNHFIYYYNEETHLMFDVDDLFYYSNHKIMKRGGHLFVSDYGMQVTLTSRYGIPPFAVEGRDYLFANGDQNDFRYANIKLLNRYTGVQRQVKKGIITYLAKIHINGDFIIGRYTDEIDAAIAYNTAADLLKSCGVTKLYRRNYIDSLPEEATKKRAESLKLSSRFLRYVDRLKNSGSNPV